MLHRKFIRYGGPLFVAIGLFCVDRFLKYLVYNQNVEWEFLSGVFVFRFVPNYQLALSLPLSYSYLLIGVLAFLFLLLVMGLYFVFSERWFEFELVTLIMFGAVSNAYDRFVHGFVIDYVSISIFPIFNIADVSIVFGTFLYTWLFLRKSS